MLAKFLSFICTAWGQGLEDPEPTNLEKCLNQDKLKDTYLAYIHVSTCMLLLGSQESSTSRLPMWKQTLGLEIDKKIWEQVCAKAQTIYNR